MDDTAARFRIGVLRWLPRELLSRMLGRLADARAPRWITRLVIRSYVSAYEVDLAEAETPPDGYRTFNEFFTRSLVPGARPIDPSPDALVCPADGLLAESGRLDGQTELAVKGQRYRAGALLGADADAKPFAGGSYAIVYLSPRDYHRVHSPLEATVEKVRHIPGTLFPVNDSGMRLVPELLVRNERVAVLLRTDTGERVALVLIGATVVGGIALDFTAPPRPPRSGPPSERVYGGHVIRLAKGVELGRFELGSTVVVLLPRSARLAGPRAGQPVRVGELLARLV